MSDRNYLVSCSLSLLWRIRAGCPIEKRTGINLNHSRARNTWRRRRKVGIDELEKKRERMKKKKEKTYGVSTPDSSQAFFRRCTGQKKKCIVKRGQGWPLSLHHVGTVVYIKSRSIWRRSTSITTNPSASQAKLLFVVSVPVWQTDYVHYKGRYEQYYSPSAASWVRYHCRERVFLRENT